MDATPISYKLAALVIGLYGLLSVVGGIMGYVKAGSVASAATGVPFGLILLLFAWGVFEKPVWSLSGAIVVALLILGFFGSNLIKNLDKFGEYLPTSAGIRAVGMVAGGLLVVIAAAIALASKSTPTP